MALPLGLKNEWAVMVWMSGPGMVRTPARCTWHMGAGVFHVDHMPLCPVDTRENGLPSVSAGPV